MKIILLYKMMLKIILKKQKRLHEKGVNYCGPVDCRKIDGISYALEYRAHGFEMNHYYKFCDKHFKSAKEYMDTFLEYMEVLKILSNATGEQYLKFFDDNEKKKV